MKTRKISAAKPATYVEKLSDEFKPRHRPGGIYCSPRCGGGCTRAEYDKAVALGKRLAKRMGKGWGYEVWENLGWHVKLVKGKVEIYCHRPRGYCCFIQTEPQFVSGTETTPRKALAHAVSIAYDALDRVSAAVRQVSADAL